LSLPRPLRYLLAHDSALLGEVVGAFIDAAFRFLRCKAKELLDLRSVSQAHPGAVTVIQRCSSDLSLNVHFHSLVTVGVFVEQPDGGPVSFHELPAPTDGEVADIAAEVCGRTRDVLVRRGRWRDDPDGPPDDDTAPEGLADVYAASLRGVLLLGPRRGDFLVGAEAFEMHEGGIVTLRPGLPVQIQGVLIDHLSASAREQHLGDCLEAQPAGEIVVAPVEVLVYLKLRSSRQKDLADVVELVKAGIDAQACRAYLQRHAPELIGRLDRAVQLAAAEER
jgi:hypothetical protein